MVSTVEEAVSDDDFNKAAIEHLRAELGDYVGEVVQSYLGDIPELLEQLRHGILSADIEQSQRLIHSLKSSSVQLGLTSLGGLAAELENRIRTGGKACSNQELDKLQQLFKRGAEHLAMYAKQTNHLPKFEIDEDRAIVVIVDDDASMRMMLRRVMETDGYQVEEASNGEQAVTLCQNVQPEIVLMDCMMPVMNGFDACEKINTMPECENTSVLMITGLNDDVTVQRAMKSGAADFITKPIFLPVLSQRVKHLIEMKQAQAHVKHLAYHDTLTGLPNRMLFNDRLQSAIKLANRHNNRLAVMFLDLDHFKKVNDSLGHSIGDKLLQMVAERIQNTLRESDTLSRMGGDEFTILLPGLAEGDDGIHSLQHLAQKMIDSLTEVFVVDNNDVFIGTSIGVSVFPDDSDDPYALVKHADAAMYYAKANGRNAFSLYCVTMNDEIHEYLQLENGLRRALERDELTVFYQPQFNLTSQKIEGMEALLRWDNPDLGSVSPAIFIPVAEESNLIVSIGKWVIEESCRQCKQWHELGFEDMTVAVNLSARQFRTGNLLAEVKGALAMSGLPAHALGLEITESITMHQEDSVIETLQQLKNIGIKISMDDFGTGYSSLSYLKRFPIDVVKIDQSFVRDITHDENDAAIVETIIAMAKSLKLGVIAEGVETQEQLEFLQSHHCHIIQGYLISKPVSAETSVSLLSSKELRATRTELSN